MTASEGTFLRIALADLQKVQSLRIDGTAPASLLEINEDEVEATSPVAVSGEAYLADQELVLSLSAKTSVTLPCSICNQPVAVELSVVDLCHAVPIATLTDGVFDLGPVIREELAFEIPQFAECQNGNCPERKAASAYMREPSDDDTQTPFAELE